ncbi:MAG: hypothetical protein R3C19_18085 [Planctomycetaceae bacterium]
MLAIPRQIFVATAAIAIIAVSGCASLEDCGYETGQRIRTVQAWKHFNSCQDQCFTRDYASGWKAGFYDVATGGSGCPPLIAPKKYHKPPVFFERDESRRDDWYTGFQDGACFAKTQPDYHYLHVWAPGPSMCLTPVCHTETFPAAPPAEPIMPPEEMVSDSEPVEPVEATEPAGDDIADDAAATPAADSVDSVANDAVPQQDKLSPVPTQDAQPADLEPFETQPVKPSVEETQPRPYDSGMLPTWDIEVIPVDKRDSPESTTGNKRVVQTVPRDDRRSFTARLIAGLATER